MQTRFVRTFVTLLQLSGHTASILSIQLFTKY